MYKSLPKHFYLFKGNWLSRFDELISLVQKNKEQHFELWEPKDKTRKVHLLIVSGKSLSETYCLVKRVFETDEDTFVCFFQPHINDYHVHTFSQEAEARVDSLEADKRSEYILK
jgi:hypothetical protein